MPRILRSPGSKSFRLENVPVPNADGGRCERRQHPRRPKAKSALGPKRKCPGSRGTSVLPSGADIVSLPRHVRLVPRTVIETVAAYGPVCSKQRTLS